MNPLVQWYVLMRFDRELRRVRFDSAMLQEKELDRILANTLSRRLNPQYAHVKSVKEFKRNVKISQYDDYQNQILNLQKDPSISVEYYARSSGTTTGMKKMIPTPESYVRKNHLRGSWYILNTLYHHSKRMNVFKAKNLLIGGAIYENHLNYLVGDVSGIMINRIPYYFRPFYVPSIATAVSPYWEEKIRKTAEAAATEPCIALVGGVPTWVLSTFRLILEHKKVKYITDLWPDLCAYIHGGVRIEPYKGQFEQLIHQKDFLYIEVYNATEGFFAIQDDPHQDGMLLMTCSGIYFEFIRLRDYNKHQESATIIPLAEVQMHEEYIMLITTQTGLWRYLQGDIVTFMSTHPYRLKVAGRISEFINAFGEDLMLSQAQEALLSTCELHQVHIAHYTVGPHYITIDEKGRHDWYIEFIIEPQDFSAFEKDLDLAVMGNNMNYAQKRAFNIALGPLSVVSIPRGTFKRYLELKDQMGGQSKIKKLSNDRNILEEIDRLIKNG